MSGLSYICNKKDHFFRGRLTKQTGFITPGPQPVRFRDVVRIQDKDFPTLRRPIGRDSFFRWLIGQYRGVLATVPSQSEVLDALPNRPKPQTALSFERDPERDHATT